MKRFLPVLFLLFTFYFLHFTFVHADFDQAYQDYLYQYGEYRTSFTNFLTAKNRYLTYKTLVSQTEALAATKAFLEARDQVLITYLQMLIEKNPQENFKKLLGDEIIFFSDHKKLIPAVGSLEDAVKVSGAVKEHFPQTEVLAKQTIANILLSKVEGLEKRLEDLETGFEEKINFLKNQGRDVTTLERWLLSAKKKRLLTHEKIIEAQSLTAMLTPKRSTTLSEDFGKIQVLIFEANQYLKEGVAYLKEIKEELKYGNY